VLRFIDSIAGINQKKRDHMKKYKPSPQRIANHSQSKINHSSGDSFALNLIRLSDKNEDHETLHLQADPQLSQYSDHEYHVEASFQQEVNEINETPNHQPEKRKFSVWQLIGLKKEERSLPKNESEKITSEEKREHMRNNDNFEPQVNSNRDESAVISRLMVIKGDINVDTPLLLAGKVIGNIVCGDHIEISSNGSVEGNITAKSIKLIGGDVKGNINCEGTLETNQETIIAGDLKVGIALISGQVTGEIRAVESVSLASTANVKGDQYSSVIGVEKGASLEGKYSISSK
jgi:cytoskeletal protein CcmA (bactofilin family)